MRKHLQLASGHPITADLGRWWGMQLVHHRHSKAQYSNLLEACKKRIEGWKSKVLSFAGWCTLATSVINSLPVFPMQTSRLPSEVTKEMDKMVRKCIWGKNKNQRKIHLVSWYNICRPKDEGGLGVRWAKEMNTTLLGRLWWGFLNEKKALWSCTLKSKYGRGQEGVNMFIPKACPSRIWGAWWSLLKS